MFIHNLTNHSFNIDGRYHINHFGGWRGRDLRIWRCDCMHSIHSTINQTTEEKKRQKKI